MAKCIITIEDSSNGQVLVKTEFFPDLNLEDDGKHLTNAQHATINLLNSSVKMGKVDEKNIKVT